MKAGNSPRLGASTRAQAAKSVQLGNRYFAGSPFRFVLAGVSQAVNSEGFHSKFDDYAAGNARAGQAGDGDFVHRSIGLAYLFRGV
jgi:hypothetical protein